MAVAQLQSMRRCYFFGHNEEQTILLIMTCGTRDPSVRLNMTIFFLMASMKDGFNIFLESFFCYFTEFTMFEIHQLFQ